MATLKIDKGTAEKLLEWKEIKSSQSRNLTGDELTLNVDDEEVSIETCRGEYVDLLELSDVNGSFGIWVELTPENVKKLKKVLEKH